MCADWTCAVIDALIDACGISSSSSDSKQCQQTTNSFNREQTVANRVAEVVARCFVMVYVQELQRLAVKFRMKLC